MSKLLRPKPAARHNYTLERLGQKCNCTDCLKQRGEFEVYMQAPRPSSSAEPAASPPVKSLLELLTEHFGLGDEPAKRNALYARLSLLAERDKRVEMLVLECVSLAEGKDRPDCYFAKAITSKLRECGVYSWPSK